jgi:D-alanyl-D-alanine carboxypeptidase
MTAMSRAVPEIFTATTRAKLDIVSDSGIAHRAENTNTGAAATTGIIGSKTGYTDLAGGNLVVVVDIGIDHPVVIAVLGSSRDGRFVDVERLIEATEEKVSALAAERTLSVRDASSGRREGVE